MTDLRHHTGATRRPARAAAVCAVTAALTILGTAACSSSSSSSPKSSTPGSGAGASTGGDGSGVTFARSQVARYDKAVTTYPSPGPALTASKVAALKGKTVLFVPIGLGGPFVVEQQSVGTALGHLGITVKTCDANFQPPQIASCFGQAKTDGAVAVISAGIPNALAANAFASLKAQGIPVLASFAGTGNPANTAQLAFQSETPATTLAGAVGADQVIAESDGKANVLFVAASGTPAVAQGAALTKAEFAKNCPGCHLTSIAFDASDTSHIASGVSSALISNPSTNYVFVQADAQLAYVLPGVQTSGFANKVKIVTGSGTPSVLLMIKQKQHNIIGDSAFDAAYIGWNAVDGALRLLTGQSVPATPYLPVRLFTPDNLQGEQITASMDVSPLFGSLSFEQQFFDRWAGKSS